MITNADITIYNVWWDPLTRSNKYNRTQIEGVHWYTDQKTNVEDKGLVSADLYKIRIPADAVVQDGRKYIDAMKYRILTADEVYGYWTINNGDLFVRGIIYDEIEKLSDLTLKYTNVCRVNSFSDNRQGLNPHIRVGGAS